MPGGVTTAANGDTSRFEGEEFGPRMSFGDHLEELRGCVIRALVGVAVAAMLALAFGQHILGIILRPLLIVQYQNGMEPGVQVLSPTGAFSAYLKISLLTGLILAMPWALLQLWRFVSAGLYAHERRFVQLLMPASLGLFVVGVAFLYFLVLPLLLQFFIQFNRGFDIPDLRGGPISRILFPAEPFSAIPSSASVSPNVPVLFQDPIDPPVGALWFSDSTKRLMIQTPTGQLASEPLHAPASSAIQSQFALTDYIGFVLTLALAFGIAFETPVVVVFLSWSNLVPRAAIASVRRYVVLGIVIIAAIITPPDVISQLMLAIPMYALFELGLLAARWLEQPKSPNGAEATNR